MKEISTLLPCPTLPQTLVPLLTEEDADTLASCWGALGAVTGSIPKEMQPSFVRCLKVGGRQGAADGAREGPPGPQARQPQASRRGSACACQPQA